MTRSELYEKYGHVKVQFISYYKYVFTYQARLPDGAILICRYGGTAGDIYRHLVSRAGTVSIAILGPDYCSVSKDGEKVDELQGE
jgi:hypothetical protein